MATAAYLLQDLHLAALTSSLHQNIMHHLVASAHFPFVQTPQSTTDTWRSTQTSLFPEQKGAALDKIKRLIHVIEKLKVSTPRINPSLRAAKAHQKALTAQKKQPL